MNQKIKCKSAIFYTLLLVMTALFLSVWPLGLIKASPVVKTGEKNLVESDPISVERNATQMFVAKGDNLEAVELYIMNDMLGQTMTFRLYDGAYTQIWEKFLVVNQEEPGFYRIPVNLETTKDNYYYFTAEGLTQDLYLAYETTSETGVPEIGSYTWGGEDVPDTNVVARYYYTSKTPWWQVLCLGAVLILAGLCLLFGMKRLPKTGFLEKEIRVHTLVKAVGNPAQVLLTVLGLIAVYPLKKFGGGPESYVFYVIGILLYGLLGLWIINHRREGDGPLVDAAQLRECWPDYLQSLFIAGALWGCIRYMNALYNYQQDIAFKHMLLFFALAVLMMLPKKQLLHWCNLVYLPIAGFAAYRYYLPYQGIPEKEDTAYITAWFGVVLGLFCIHLVWFLIGRRVKKGTIAWPYTIAVAVLFLLLILFRNTRGWPITMAAAFGLCYLFYAGWEHRERFVANLENGILLHFVLAILFLLFRRPYHAWYMYRFSGTFHTVTETAVYLTVMLCAVLVRLLHRYEERASLSHIWKELLLFGIGVSYLFITLSRTGYLAVAVMCIVIFVFVCGFCYRQSLGRILKQVLLYAVCTVVLFPVLFTAQRILPAVYNDPYIFPLEEAAYGDYTVKRGEPWNSDNYMTIPRFLRVVNVKLGGEHDTAKALPHKMRSAYDELKYGSLAYVEQVGQAVAAADYVPEEEPRTDISNGRVSLFRLYISNWNLWGHEAMGIPDPANGGAVTAHAHNTYLQVIHDHGLAVGLVYLLFGIFTAIQLFRYTREKIKTEPYAALPLALFVAFAAASLVEWVFFPCNPMGFAVLVSLTPLICFQREKSYGKEKR